MLVKIFFIRIVKHKLCLLSRARSTLRHQEHDRVSGYKGTAIRFLCIAFELDIVGMDGHIVKMITQIFRAGVLPFTSRSSSFGIQFENVSVTRNMDTSFHGQVSEPPRLLPVTLPVTRHGTSKDGHKKVNNKKESKEMNKKND